MGSSSQPDEILTMEEILEEQTRLEEEVKEVLPFDITRCSKPLGQIRQAVYSCLTCNPIDNIEHTRAGVCSSCSVSCHTDHQLVELFVRRNFVCDCGTIRCNLNNCHLDHSFNPQLGIKNQISTHSNNISTDLTNKYDKNFDGKFCFCEKGQNYNPETETEDMFQCLACEDWRHTSCLGPHPDPDEWDDLICADCVQNDPIISSIIYKYAGGNETGMIVCNKSQTDEIVCYGRLSSTLNSNHSINLQSPCTEEQVNPIIQKEELNKEEDKLNDHEDNFEKKDEPVQLISSNNKRSPSPSLRNDSNQVNKLQKLESTQDEIAKQNKNEPLKKNDRREEKESLNCKAPFKSRSESILNKLDAKYSNVYLMAGWRNRWCNCTECHTILSKLNWLIEDEEDVWEPGEDNESLKSIHELGLEAIKKLPRDQMINGILAYNKFKSEFLNFLKPFHSSNKLITEVDILNFFQKIKQNQNHS